MEKFFNNSGKTAELDNPSSVSESDPKKLMMLDEDSFQAELEKVRQKNNLDTGKVKNEKPVVEDNLQKDKVMMLDEESFQAELEKIRQENNLDTGKVQEQQPITEDISLRNEELNKVRQDLLNIDVPLDESAPKTSINDKLTFILENPRDIFGETNEKDLDNENPDFTFDSPEDNLSDTETPTPENLPVQEPEDEVMVAEQLEDNTEIEKQKVLDEFSEQNPDLPKKWLFVRKSIAGFNITILPKDASTEGNITSLNIPDNVNSLFISGNLPQLENVNFNNREDFKLIVDGALSSIDVSNIKSIKDVTVHSTGKLINLSGLKDVNSLKVMGSIGELDLSNLTDIQNLDLNSARINDSTIIKLSSGLDEKVKDEFIKVFGDDKVTF